MKLERWKEYNIEQQILMIGTEFARAKSLILKNKVEETRKCYERAFEMLDLSKNDFKWRSRLRELTRFREILGDLYLNEISNFESCNQFYKVLLQWHPATSKVEL